MRIRFHEGPPLAVHEAIARWWKAFEENAAKIDAYFNEADAAFDVEAFMEEYLGAIDPRLMWEFGHAMKGGRHRLMLTPEGDRHLKPLTEAVLAAAPQNTAFEFYFGRIAEPNEDHVGATVRGRTQHSIAGWAVAVEPSESGGLTFKIVPRAEQLTAENIVEAAYVAMESLIGEPLLEPWCDEVIVSSGEANAVPLPQAPEVIRREIETLRERLPSVPNFEMVSAAKWSIFELKPAPADDYAHQNDLVLARTMNAPMWEAARMQAFFSERFSRFGETFCYVKFDSKETLKERFAEKSAMHGALERALAGTALGAVVGSGTGLRYGYVDLALTDVDRAIPVIRETLRKAAVDRRAWLLFHDDTLAAEWVGIWPDSPEPPGLPE